MTSIIFNAISGIEPNNGSSISVNIGKKQNTYIRNVSSTPPDISILNSKYQSKFFNDIEYNLLPSSGYIINRPSPTPTKTINYTNTPTATVSTTPTITVTQTPTPTVTTSVSLTPTNTPTQTLTPTVTNTSTQTPTPTLTNTPTNTPTVSTSAPGLIMTNSANYNNCGGRLASVGTSGRSSYYSTYDMSGNIWEWLETSVGPYSKVLRGGNLVDNTSYIASTSRAYTDKSFGNSLFGFRIASSALSPLYNNLVFVGDTNNSADTSGYGSVSYTYHIGKYEVTNNEYLEFLNSIAQTDTYNLYNSAMNWSNLGGITRTGSVGSYEYTAKTNMGNKPVNFLNWASCARYCNWLSNNRPVGAQTTNTTENGSYDMTLADPPRNNNTSFFLPNENEWYKAAYYKGGSANAGYWLYATQSDTEPSCVQLTLSGDGIPV